MRKTLKNLFVEYGAIAVVVYFVLFFGVWVAFWAAIRFGWNPSGTLASVGTWTAAYLATKVTQPIRIAATLIITPLIAKIYERLTGRPRAASTFLRDEVASDHQQV